jgi:hypothetical protein
MLGQWSLTLVIVEVPQSGDDPGTGLIRAEYLFLTTLHQEHIKGEQRAGAVACVTQGAPTVVQTFTAHEGLLPSPVDPVLPPRCVRSILKKLDEDRVWSGLKANGIVGVLLFDHVHSAPP